jgi:hypothetical protein
LGSKTDHGRAEPLTGWDVFARQAVGSCPMQLSRLELQQGRVEAAVTYGRLAVDTYESLRDGDQTDRKAYAWMALARAGGQSGRTGDACQAARRA